MTRRLLVGFPLLTFYLAFVLGLSTLVATRVDAGGIIPAKWATLALQWSGLAQLTGAGTAADDDFLIYDTSVTTLKRISRSELASVVGSNTYFCIAHKTADQTVSVSSDADVAFGGEQDDVDNIFGSPSVTVPADGAGVWVFGYVGKIAQGTTNQAELRLQRNGSDINANHRASITPQTTTIGAPISLTYAARLSAADTVKWKCNNNSGSFAITLYGGASSGPGSGTCTYMWAYGPLPGSP